MPFIIMVRCPICQWTGKEFLPFGKKRTTCRTLRKNAKCPQCGSLERHRLYYLYLKKVIDKEKLLKVLHFAPEKALTAFFKSYENIKYLSADINPKAAMVKEDMTNLSFKNNSFDIILCSHVLDDIKDDRKAMRELYRVLKPDGFAILQVTISDKDKTYEFSMTFGRSDDFRIYGKDYKNRLESCGFKVKVDRFVDFLSDYYYIFLNS